MDGLLIDTAPLALRNRALALAGAGLMFTQGAGFALWGIAGQYIPPAAAICSAAAAGVLAVTTLRPRQPPRRGRPGAAQRPSGTAISPSRDQSSCGTTTFTIFGVRTRKRRQGPLGIPEMRGLDVRVRGLAVAERLDQHVLGRVRQAP